MLSTRRTQVLTALIDEYVLSSVPVSSSILAARYLPNYSAATIRNELLGLETAGLAFAPHTSAGRIPTNQGYRLFVNHLLLRPLSLLAANPIITPPPALENSEHLPVSRTAVLREALDALSASTDLLALYWDPDANLGLVVRGLTRLAKQPEFSESSRLLPLISLIEEQEQLVSWLQSLLQRAELSIQIGLEPSGLLAGCTLLARRGSSQNAIFGLLGPTRLDYRRALIALDNIAQLNFNSPGY